MLLSLLVVTALFRLSAALDFVCPVEDIVRTQCIGVKDCMYPHPTTCRKYIHCEVNTDGVARRPTVKDCPGNFEWNNNDKTCDLPENSTCPTRHNVVATANDVHKETSDILARGDGVENKIRDAAPAPFQCLIGDAVITQCRGEKDCVYPNPGSCNTYIQCSVGSDFLPGAPAVKNCPPGHEWNDKDKKCDLPEKSTCPVYANTKGASRRRNA
ncbi:hypothetical protein ACLOAV_007774 [Pseudogymnoascus australis]